MPFRLWFQAPRRVLVLFVTITLVPAAALGWLGWWALKQNRALDKQRETEGLELLADRVSGALDRALADLQGRLDSPATSLPEDTILLSAGPKDLEATPAGRLVYYPMAPAGAEPPSARFAAADELELRRQDPAAAIALLRKEIENGDPSVRAGALLRLGRNEKKLGHPAAALAAYSELARLGEVRVEGLPAEMAAREARCRLYEQAGRVKELAAEAAALHAGLREGRWRIARATWQFHLEEAARWMSPPEPAPLDGNQLALAAAAEWVYQRWQADRDSSGRQFLTLEGRPVMVAWKATASKLRAAAAGPRAVHSALNPVARDPGVSIALSDAAGLPVLGRPATHPRVQVVRVAAASGLPWTLHVARTDPAAPSAQSRFLAAGGAMLALLLVGGGYFVFRAMAREMAVAQLQSDFVSAVSHEFRSPLTSIRQLSHLLASDRVPGDDQRGRVYGALVRESERLHTLVEALLDFGRMEAGSLRYRLEPLDPVQLVTEVTEAFRLNPAALGYSIQLRAEPGLPRVAADREALSRALWNLLDNAVKYSPESKDIFAEVAGQASGVAIRVRDQGLGIPGSQHKEIFKKFVRGNPASAVIGTGIGLAMVEHIVRGHRGRILLDSEPGRGSTFTILLPAQRRS